MDIEYSFIFGCPRSGTTYLSRLMDRLPHVESVVGNVIPVLWMHIARQPLEPEMYKAFKIGFERALSDYAHSGSVHSRAAALQKWYNSGAGLMELPRAARGKRVVKNLVYKEPVFAFAPEFVFDSVPTAKSIYIVRDGRDVANSLVESYNENFLGVFGRQYENQFVPWWVEDGLDEEFISASRYGKSIWMWKAMVSHCSTYFESLSNSAKSRLYAVHYEELMRNPLDVGHALARHIGGKPGKAYDKMLGAARESSIGKYKSRPPKEIEEAERIAGNELRKLGYMT